MSALLTQQQQFTQMISLFIRAAYARGYQLTFGHALRCEECPVGKKNSFHKKRLACDLNAFRDGVYLQTTEEWRELGELWEQMGGTWGGRWQDGNHLSLGEGK